MEDLGHHFREVGVTGYPEGHPFISGDLLRQALIDKERHATYIATQMCFDPAAIFAWSAAPESTELGSRSELAFPELSTLYAWPRSQPASASAPRHGLC